MVEEQACFVVDISFVYNTAQNSYKQWFYFGKTSSTGEFELKITCLDFRDYLRKPRLFRAMSLSGTQLFERPSVDSTANGTSNTVQPILAVMGDKGEKKGMEE